MDNFYNFNQFAIDYLKSFDGANGLKYGLIINDTSYMLKTLDPSKQPLGNDFFPYAEYLSCNILSSLGLNCQETLLGEFKLPFDNHENVLAVACKNFRPNREEFTPFYNLRNSRFYGSSSSNSRSCELSEILSTIDTQHYIDPTELKNFFWKQFIGDALIGNFDRHNGNWGLLTDSNNQVSICPIFDCSSSMFCRIQDRYLFDFDNRQSLLESCCYDSCKSAIEYNGKKINYFDFISQNIDPDCTKSLFVLIDKIDLNKINQIIENAPIKHDCYKQFCLELISARKKYVIDHAYNQIKNPSTLNHYEKLVDYDEYDRRIDVLLTPIEPFANELNNLYKSKFQKIYSELKSLSKINDEKRVIDTRVDASIVADLMLLKRFKLEEIKNVVKALSPVYAVKEDDYIDRTINRAKQIISDLKRKNTHNQ
ncbi:MAG: hypothetical protein ACI4M7_03080 [Succinivibrio sp.]